MFMNMVITSTKHSLLRRGKCVCVKRGFSDILKYNCHMFSDGGLK